MTTDDPPAGNTAAARSGRRRAPGMSPDDRRKMIVNAALPLLAEQGAAVTTSQIARAAGIGEATVFRVFADKEQLLHACVEEVCNPAHIVDELAAVPIDQPVEGRLKEAAGAVGAHFTRLGAVLTAVHASGAAHRDPRPARTSDGADRSDGAGRPRAAGREESIALVRDAVADLLEPDAESFRVPVEHVASFYLGLLFSNGRIPAERRTGIDALIDILLNGARATDADGPPR